TSSIDQPPVVFAAFATTSNFTVRPVLLSVAVSPSGTERKRQPVLQLVPSPVYVYTCMPFTETESVPLIAYCCQNSRRMSFLPVVMIGADWRNVWRPAFAM